MNRHNSRDTDDSSSCSSSFDDSDSSASLSSDRDAEQGYSRRHEHDHPSSYSSQRNNHAAVRRRMAPSSGNGTANSNSDREEHRHHHRHHKHHHHRHRHHRQKSRPSWFKCHCQLRHVPTYFLIACFFFWLAVQTSNVYSSISRSTQPKKERGSIGQRNARLAARGEPTISPRHNHKSPGLLQNTGAFLSDAVEGFMDLVALPTKLFHQASRGEALPPGCVRSPWQVKVFVNCNDVHEADLYQAFTSGEGYVGAGYWRHVWLVDPRNEYNGGTVLKMMKSEHKVERRNFERHRRDALAMERLTSSKFIVDIYAYCGNSVLTEYVGSDMHQVLLPDDRRPAANQPPPPTDREKLRLALEVVSGVADLHTIPGGPIVHADIADKQFLVDERGHVKLNDFNRCRFMGHKRGTKEKCSFRIPSAPGRHRSPEEYSDEELTEQLDTYSTANVLYQILTGTEPWAGMPSSQLKRAVKKGHKPPIDDELRVAGTPTAILADLIDQAYELDPAIRITAPALVEALQKALQE